MDFSRWLDGQSAEAKQREIESARLAHIDSLESEGVINAEADGSFTAQCCRCGDWTELPVGPEEIDIDYTHWCDDPTHYERRYCPHCLGTGDALWLKYREGETA